MAIQKQVNQSSREEKIYPLDFTPALLAGATIVGAELYYSSDNDVENSPELSSTIVGNMIYVSVSNLEVGFHKVRCLAITSNADLTPEIELLISTKT